MSYAVIIASVVWAPERVCWELPASGPTSCHVFPTSCHPRAGLATMKSCFAEFVCAFRLPLGGADGTAPDTASPDLPTHFRWGSANLFRRVASRQSRKGPRAYVAPKMAMRGCREGRHSRGASKWRVVFKGAERMGRASDRHTPHRATYMCAFCMMYWGSTPRRDEPCP